MFYFVLFLMFIWITANPDCFELEHMNPVSFFILMSIGYYIRVLINATKNFKK